QMCGGARALFGEQIGDHDLHPFRAGEPEERGWNSAEGMQEISGLGVIPPAEKFDFQADLFQGLFGLLDLNLLPAMSKGEGNLMVEEDFHGGEAPGLTGMMTGEKGFKCSSRVCEHLLV